LRFEDTLCGYTKVEIILQRLLNESLQYRVPEDSRPLLITK
jgi:hypothetical protein